MGSRLCERLLSEGYRVVCMDNLRTGTLENVGHLANEADFEHPGANAAAWCRFGLH